MPTFDTFVSRHGESWVLFIIEEIERVEGVLYRDPVPLEDRWNVLMGLGPRRQFLTNLEEK